MMGSPLALQKCVSDVQYSPLTKLLNIVAKLLLHATSVYYNLLIISIQAQQKGVWLLNANCLICSFLHISARLVQ